MPITPKEENQELLPDNLVLEDKTYPKQVRNLYVNNIFKRSLSYLIGKGKNKSLRIRSTENGALYVVNAGGCLNFHGTSSHTMTDDDAKDYDLGHVASRVDLWVWDNDAKITFTADNYPVEDFWIIEAGAFYSFDAKIEHFIIKNATAGSNTKYQFVYFMNENV